MKGRIRIAALGALAISAFTLIGGAAGTSVGAAAPNGYSASVTAQGLNLNLFGQKLLGGNSTACVNDGSQTANTGSPCDGKATPYSYAAGSGTVLTSAGLSNDATAFAAGDSQSLTEGTPSVQKCSPVSSGGAQGADNVTVDLGVGCGFATASNDATGDPSAYSGGEIATVGINAGGLLAPIVGASTGASKCTTSPSQLIGALLNTVCQVLGAVGGSAPPPAGTLIPGVEQALQNIFDIVTQAVDNLDTVDVSVGGATSAVCSGQYNSTTSECANDTTGDVTAETSGSTLDVKLLQGVGCTAGTPLATCALNEVTNLKDESANPTAAPLIEIKVGPASCTATRDPSTGEWTSTDASSLVDVDVNLPGDNISLNIPGTSGTGQTILSGTPLQSTISIANGASAPIGDTASCSGDSLTLNLLQSSDFPGGSSTVGAVYAALGSTTLSASNNNVAAPVKTTPATTPAPAAVTPVVPAAVVPNVTTVHTGEFWSGVLPIYLLAGMGGTGIALIARRRIASAFRSLTRRGSKLGT
jgi:hypothetical protein